MKFKWDFKELENFGKRLQNTENLDTALMTATQKIARLVHQALLQYTPVDTGNLRKMWSAGDNLLFTVDKVGDDFQVTFVNTARAESADGYMYGIAVNDGHRTTTGGWVMGRFFVEKSILQVENSSRLNAMVKAELSKWFEGCINGK